MRRILFLFCILLSVPSVLATCPGAEIGTTTISSDIIWDACTTNVTGNINIGTGGILHVNNGTTIQMNVSSDLQYAILLTGTGKLYINDSNISSSYKNFNTPKNSQIRTVSGTPSVHVENGTFSYLGSLSAPFLRSGAFSFEAGTDHHIYNSTFTRVVSAATVYATHLDVIGTTVVDSGSTTNVGTANYAWNFWHPVANIHTIFNNNRVINYTSKCEAQPIYADTWQNFEMNNNAFNNLTYTSGLCYVHQINFYETARNFTITNLTQNEHGTSVTFNNPNNNNPSYNGILDGLYWDNPYGAVLGFTYANSNFTVRNVSVTNASGTSGTGLYFSTETDAGYAMADMKFYDMSYRGGSTVSIIRGVMKNSIVKNVSIIGSSYRNFFWTRISPFPPNPDTGNRYENFTFYGTAINEFSSSCPGYALACIDYSVNNTFIDWNLTKTDAGSTIEVGGNSANNRFINIDDKDRVVVNSGSFYEKYAYIDVLVQNNLSQPVSGATVTFQNTINSNYPSINRSGKNKTSFITGSNGHLALPLESDSETAVIAEYIINSGTKTYQSYNVSASKVGNSSSTTLVTANDTWYRSAPNTAPYTVVLTINEATSDPVTNYIPPVPTIIDPTTSGFNVSYTWQPGAGNVTNSYNVSWNGTWTNGSGTLGRTETVGAHGWGNITLFAYNSSGTGESSLTSASDSKQIPNNPIIQENIGTKSVIVGSYLNFTVNATDADGDTILHYTNATKGTLNATTGEYSFLATGEDTGTYVWSFNSTNTTWGGNASETITVSVVNTTNIYGYVNTTASSACSLCDVYLTYQNGSRNNLFKTTTDGTGYYTFAGVTIDSYYVFAEQVNESSNRTTNFTLTSSDSWQNLTLIDTVSMTTTQTASIDASSSFDFDVDSKSYSVNDSTNCSDFSDVTGIGTCTFAVAGNYSVKLGVTDSDGFSTNNTILFEVIQGEAPPITEFIPANITSCSTNSKNTTYINFSCSYPGGVNVTDSMNFTDGTTWNNGSSSVNFTGLTEDTIYNYQIWAYNNSGSGSLSNGAFAYQETTDAEATPNLRLSGTIVPPGSTISVTGHGSLIGGTYDFEQTLLSGVEVWVNVSHAGYVSNNSQLTISEDTIYNVTLSLIPGCDVSPVVSGLANTTSNFYTIFYANHTWTNDANTSSINLSVNGTWINGTNITSYNNSVGVLGWSNVSVQAYNSTCNNLSSPTMMNTQALNWTYYSLTGNVTNSTGSKLAAAVISSLGGSTISNASANGNYSFLVHNGSQTISASLTGYDTNSTLVNINGATMSGIYFILTLSSGSLPWDWAVGYIIAAGAIAAALYGAWRRKQR